MSHAGHESRPLDYAAAQRNARHRRWWVIVIAVLSLIAFGVTMAPSLYRRGVALYFQRQCLPYTAPPDQIVASTFPADVDALEGPDYVIQRSIPSVNGVYAYRKPPECLAAFDAQTGGAVTAGTAPEPPLTFLHERTSPDGTRWLVAVWLDTTSLHYTTTEVSGWTTGARRGKSLSIIGIDGILVIMTPTGTRRACYRIFAGQPDAVDASHFTIAKQYEHEPPQLWDGYVTDNGHVELSDRPSGSTVPVPPRNFRR